MNGNEINDKIKEIILDNRSGASQLARKALRVLRFAAQSSEEETREGFLEDFNNVGRRLFDARSSMASILNLVSEAIYEVNIKESRNLDSIRSYAISKIDELCRKSELNVKKVTEFGAGIIYDSEKVVTCSYSSTIFETFKLAKEQGKAFKVLVAESMSGKMHYGRTLARELEAQNIPTKVFPDKAITIYVSRSKKALVGADSILADGSLINGLPTYRVALAAKESSIPFYSVCETTKFNTLSYIHREPDLEIGFDLCPSKLITGIITEKGVIKPSDVSTYMKESKYLEKLEMIARLK